MRTAELFIAWNDDYYAVGECPASAAELLHEGSDSTLPFRVARFELQLPNIDVEEAGSLTIGSQRQPLRLVD